MEWLWCPHCQVVWAVALRCWMCRRPGAPAPMDLAYRVEHINDYVS